MLHFYVFKVLLHQIFLSQNLQQIRNFEFDVYPNF